MLSLNHVNEAALSSLHQQIEAYQPGKTLAADFYTSALAHQLDMNLFQRSWVFVATVCDLPYEGDYLVVNIAQDSIILVRNLDGEIKGFHNVCCHRGSQVLLSQQGSCASLVCHYHQWTYNLNGQLIYAGNMGDDFDTSQFQLQPIFVEVLQGLIFVNIKGYDDSIKAVKAMAEPYLKAYQLEHLKVAWVDEDIRQANWKLVMENNRECFHCNSNHPELVVSLLAEGFGNSITDDKLAQLFELKNKEWDELGLPHQEQDFPDDLWMRLVRLPLANGALSQTPDGSSACQKLIAGFSYPETSELSVWTYPNSWHHFMNDYVVTFSVLPIDAERTMIRTVWLVHQDAVEGQDYDLDNLTAVWKQTNDQDARLFESVMVGIQSSAYQVGPLAAEERFVQGFLDWYIKQLRGLAKNQ